MSKKNKQILLYQKIEQLEKQLDDYYAKYNRYTSEAHHFAELAKIETDPAKQSQYNIRANDASLCATKYARLAKNTHIELDELRKTVFN